MNAKSSRHIAPPDRMFEYAKSAADRGVEVIIAGAGGAAHLPGMVASQTVLPVLGVPVKSRALNGLDSLLSIVQMPGGVSRGNARDRGIRSKERRFIGDSNFGKFSTRTEIEIDRIPEQSDRESDC